MIVGLRRLAVLVIALVCASACSTGPKLIPPPIQAEPLGQPEQFATPAELSAAIAEHLDRVRSARVEIRGVNLPDLPPGVGVVRFRPTYATDVVRHFPARATAPESDVRYVEVDGASYGSTIGDSASQPWKRTGSGGGGATAD